MIHLLQDLKFLVPASYNEESVFIFLCDTQNYSIATETVWMASHTFAVFFFVFFYNGCVWSRLVVVAATRFFVPKALVFTGP